MKKLLILGLSVLFLVGCDTNNQNELTNKEEITSLSSVYDIDAEFKKAKKMVEEDLTKPKNLGISTTDILNIFTQETDSDISFQKDFEQENGIVAKTYQNDLGTIKMVLSFEKDNDTSFSAILFADSSNDSAKKTILNIIDKIKNEIPSNLLSNIGELAEDFGDGRYAAGFKVIDSHKTFSLYKDLNPDDFLSDINRLNDVKIMIFELRFKDLSLYIEKFINTNKPNENDFSYSLLSLLSDEDKKEIIENLFVDEDKIEFKNKLYYKNKNNISENTLVVPYINDSGFLVLDSGFIKNDWLFANKVIFTINDKENVEVSDTSPIRNVLDNGMIEEIITGGYQTDSFAEKFNNATEINIRFKGKDEDFDSELSFEEVESIRSLSKINGLKNKLSNVVFYYENKWNHCNDG